MKNYSDETELLCLNYDMFCLKNDVDIQIKLQYLVISILISVNSPLNANCNPRQLAE